jgi:hypothetical protein
MRLTDWGLLTKRKLQERRKGRDKVPFKILEKEFQTNILLFQLRNIADRNSKEMMMQ